MKLYVIPLIAFLLSSCSSNQTLPKSIAKYYPTQAESIKLNHGGVMGLTREPYERILLDDGPDGRLSGDAKDFYLAYHGDSSAFHRFLNSADRGEQGEYGEAWVSNCFILILRWKDPDLKKELISASSEVRKDVYFILKTYLDEKDKERYPLTLAFLQSSKAEQGAAANP